jgi:hypothetical protein
VRMAMCMPALYPGRRVGDATSVMMALRNSPLF